LDKLVSAAELDPRSDLRFGDWRGFDLTDADLRGFDFTGADLAGAKFDNALVKGAIFDGARYELASLRKAADFDYAVTGLSLRPSGTPGGYDIRSTLGNTLAERTRELEIANELKSRFLAAAAHDLRQPLHALGLFVAQLHGKLRAGERAQIVGRIEGALAAMNELFSALLDVSKLDAGATTVNITAFPIAQLLAHAETTFAGAALEKGLSFRVLPSDVWVRSDFILLERAVFNLITNALRYTRRGGVLVGCRKRGGDLRIEVWDSGIGIAADQQDKIFGEFYRLGEPDRDRRAGLGLGLAIVDRVCRLLDHSIEVESTVGRGSVFAITVPIAPAHKRALEAAFVQRTQPSLPSGKLVLVVDNDPLAREGMGGIFRKWGCRVITANSDSNALEVVREQNEPPDLIISDYYLANNRNGIETIEWLRSKLSAEIPAVLISDNADLATLHEATAKSVYLLHKPVNPTALRAMFDRAIKPPAEVAARPLHVAKGPRSNNDTQ
jgi:signal transduction histidine kinase/CheY-like chemotaxis protein